MLVRYMSSKPLYEFERKLDYLKHREKLKNINSKSPDAKPKSVDAKLLEQLSLKRQAEKQNRVIEEEN